MFAFTYLRQLLPPSSRQKRGGGQESMEQGAAVKNLLGRDCVQPKLEVGQQGDRYEREADLIARYVTQGPGGREIDVSEEGGERPQRLCAECEEEVQAKAKDGVSGVTVDSTSIKRGLGSGESLPGKLRKRFEPRFNRDFGGVRIHRDKNAAQAAESIRAKAFTMGRDIIFGENQYRPESRSGGFLLAHELTHVIQQGRAERRDGPEMERETTPAPTGIQRYPYSSPTGRTDPNALIPINDFITYVEAVERGYSSDSPEQILTRIRTQYYNGLAFEVLIPDAPYSERTGTRQIFNPRTGESYETPITRDRRIEQSVIGSSAHSHLTAHADENARGDNPSPYIVLPGGQRLDVGHLLLGLDALLHPRTRGAFAAYSVPNIDPSSWVADLGIASVWMTTHQETGSPHGDVVNPPSSADLATYYDKSAPIEDLLGDVDSFGLHAQWQATPGQSLSQVMRGYYLGSGATSIQRRFQLFASANGFGYTRRGNTITWDSALRARLVALINRFNDLYAEGRSGAAWTMITGSTTHRTWPHTPAVVDRFLTWVKTNLEAELGP